MRTSVVCVWLLASALAQAQGRAAGPPPTAKETKQYQQTRERLRKLEAEWKEQQMKVYDEWKRKGEAIADLSLAPRKSDVQVTRFGLAWAPFWRVALPDGASTLRAAY